jgi:hypothetical protein
MIGHVERPGNEHIPGAGFLDRVARHAWGGANSAPRCPRTRSFSGWPSASLPGLRQVRHRIPHLTGLAMLLAGMALPAQGAVVDCQANRPGAANVLYLYYPTATDNNFPDDVGSVGETTSPLPPFDVADLDAGIGSTADLRAAITERVKRDYCEFDVRVVQTTSANGTTNPNPSDPRWQVIGIGSDGNGGLFGIADNVDIGDSLLTDFARIWADSFGNQYGGPGGALAGANSTFSRWANAIAGTVSHEAGHNYGLKHSDSAAKPSEDPQNNHLLATGSTGLTGEDRVEERHFSDTSFEMLAANIGLFEQTVSNWDFINPNDTTADGFRITVLVLPSAGTPSKTSMYTGGLSPWGDVSISANGTETFKGTLYNRFTIDFVSPKSWNNGANGQVPAGEEFHVGVGLDKAYIVRNTALRAGGSDMTLNPRVVGYTTGGSFDPATGDFHVTFSNPEPEKGPLVLSNFTIRHMPRTIDIDEMVPGGKLTGIDGLPVVPWQVRKTDTDPVFVHDTADVTLGNLAEKRAVDHVVTPDPTCKRGIQHPPPVGDINAPSSIEYCPEGHALGLFPSTRVYFEATLTDPNARYFDRTLQSFVVGPLKTRIFVQLPGVKPDLNDNGIDDAIDITNGTCKDDNRNGVCDDAEPRFRYAAKLLCGTQDDPENLRLAQGSYATAINIHNPNDSRARFTKRLALTFPPEGQQPGKVLTIGKDVLAPGEALEVDCVDIRRRLFPNGFPESYIKGFVVLQSDRSLDVTGVYTTRGIEPRKPCCDADKPVRKCADEPRACCPERGKHAARHAGCDAKAHAGCCPATPVCPREDPPCHKDCGKAQAGPPASIDVETIPERIMPLGKPPVRMCPDLVIRDIGRPSVTCPAGARSCETTVRITVANIGNASAGPFKVRTVLDPSQSVVVDSDVPGGLNAGAELALTVVTPPGGNCFDPDCTVSATADSGDAVDECDENNNTRSSTTPG